MGIANVRSQMLCSFFVWRCLRYRGGEEIGGRRRDGEDGLSLLASKVVVDIRRFEMEVGASLLGIANSRSFDRHGFDQADQDRKGGTTCNFVSRVICWYGAVIG